MSAPPDQSGEPAMNSSSLDVSESSAPGMQCADGGPNSPRSPDDRASLESLLANVERATRPDRALDGAMWARLVQHEVVVLDLTGGYVPPSTPALTASVDAALALVERVLPGACVLMQITPAKTLANLHTQPVGIVGQWGPLATGPSAPLAILAALLRALQSQEAAPLSAPHSADEISGSTP